MRTERDERWSVCKFVWKPVSISHIHHSHPFTFLVACVCMCSLAMQEKTVWLADRTSHTLCVEKHTHRAHTGCKHFDPLSSMFFLSAHSHYKIRVHFLKKKREMCAKERCMCVNVNGGNATVRPTAFYTIPYILENWWQSTCSYLNVRRK